MSDKKVVGFGLTGSFCTLSAAINQMQIMADTGYSIVPIVSYSVSTMDTRFGKSSEFIDRIEDICKRKVIRTIQEAEPIGPSGMLDIMVVMPCTGNTLAKLCYGITDTPVTMACKAHMRNNRPLLLSVATNDGLSSNFKNIGNLMNMKNIYFVPLRQDDSIKKPQSIVSDPAMLIASVEAALKGERLQPQLY